MRLFYLTETGTVVQKQQHHKKNKNNGENSTCFLFPVKKIHIVPKNEVTVTKWFKTVLFTCKFILKIYVICYVTTSPQHTQIKGSRHVSLMTVRMYFFCRKATASKTAPTPRLVSALLSVLGLLRLAGVPAKIKHDLSLPELAPVLSPNEKGLTW